LILLDTHFALWAALQPERLPARVAKLIGERDTAVAFSVATLWEVAIKASVGRPDFTVDAVELRRWLLVEGFSEVPIQPAHVLHVARLPWHHRDPFDRLLVAQAALEGLTLWTVDATMKPYGAMVKVMAAR
jgi:PIN domain nuclease of toxin-antitoxin system